MAFFGLTQLGFQNSIRDNMRGGTQLQDDGCTNTTGGLSPSFREQQGSLGHEDIYKNLLQPPCYSADDHHRSCIQYKELVRRAKTITSHNQLYRMPLTENQQYGWMLSQTPAPWAQTPRFPRKTSDITKFINEISKRGHDCLPSCLS